MSQVEEFVKIVEGVKDHDVKVVVVTGKPGSGKSKVLREAAEEKKWDYIDCRLLITEKFLEVPPGERQAKAPEMMADILEGYDSEVILLDRLQTLFVPVFHIDVDALLHTRARALAPHGGLLLFRGSRRPGRVPLHG